MPSGLELLAKVGCVDGMIHIPWRAGAGAENGQPRQGGSSKASSSWMPKVSPPSMAT